MLTPAIRATQSFSWYYRGLRRKSSISDKLSNRAPEWHKAALPEVSLSKQAFMSVKIDGHVGWIPPAVNPLARIFGMNGLRIYAISRVTSPLSHLPCTDS